MYLLVSLRADAWGFSASMFRLFCLNVVDGALDFLTIDIFRSWSRNSYSKWIKHALRFRVKRSCKLVLAVAVSSISRMKALALSDAFLYLLLARVSQRVYCVMTPQESMPAQFSPGRV